MIPVTTQLFDIRSDRLQEKKFIQIIQFFINNTEPANLLKTSLPICHFTQCHSTQYIQLYCYLAIYIAIYKPIYNPIFGCNSFISSLTEQLNI